jgi:hypothetical protein
VHIVVDRNPQVRESCEGHTSQSASAAGHPRVFWRRSALGTAVHLACLHPEGQHSVFVRAPASYYRRGMFVVAETVRRLSNCWSERWWRSSECHHRKGGWGLLQQMWGYVSEYARPTAPGWASPPAGRTFVEPGRSGSL